MEDFRTVPVILHGLELLDVVVPDQGAREQRRELRVSHRVPDNLVLGMGCIMDTGMNIYPESLLMKLRIKLCNREMVKLGKRCFQI